ncbi:MAG TPA: hypothetical protein VMU22_05735 [Rhizomicrobium sp.]|nr:hypothetical protein [Rhizomicrobium sp.]
MSLVNPTPEQLHTMVENGPEGAIVMVNLLKYRQKADYAADCPEAGENLSGLEAYRRYGIVALNCVSEAGGGLVWGGKQAFVFIGGAEQDWDEVICVRYPSRQAFLQMIARKDYLAATYHRDAGLARTALLCCKAGMAA